MDEKSKIKNTFYKELKKYRYSVGNLVLPHQNSYLASGMWPNLVAHNFGLPQWILTSRVAIESLGYGECCIRVWVYWVQGWPRSKWIRQGVILTTNWPFKLQFLMKISTFLLFSSNRHFVLLAAASTNQSAPASGRQPIRTLPSFSVLSLVRRRHSFNQWDFS